MPVERHAGPLQRSDIKLGDMNGDGIADIVRVRNGDISYWPGRGNGFWGTGERDDCPAGTFCGGPPRRDGHEPAVPAIQGDVAAAR